MQSASTSLALGRRNELGRWPFVVSDLANRTPSIVTVDKLGPAVAVHFQDHFPKLAEETGRNHATPEATLRLGHQVVAGPGKDVRVLDDNPGRPRGIQVNSGFQGIRY